MCDNNNTVVNDNKPPPVNFYLNQFVESSVVRGNILSRASGMGSPTNHPGSRQ